MEIVTVVAILVIIGYSLSILVSQVMKSYNSMKAEQEVIDQARSLFLHLNRDVENIYVNNADTRYAFVASNTRFDATVFSRENASTGPIIEVGYYRNGTQLMRRLETNNVPNSVTDNGGTASVMAEGISNFAIRMMYKNASGNFQYATNWDSRIEHFANYDSNGINRNPDGLPDAVEVSFSLQDAAQRKAQKSFITKIFLPNDKYR